jgi:hypothetical protein
MTTPSASEAKDLLILAERMGIPIDEALRQVARVIADAEHPIVERTIVLSPAPMPAPQPVLEPDPMLEPHPARASVS